MINLGQVWLEIKKGDKAGLDMGIIWQCQIWRECDELRLKRIKFL